MTKTIPHYLRIHRESASITGTDRAPVEDPVNHFWSAYSDATGWRVDKKTSNPGKKMELLPAVNTETFEQERDDSVTPVGKSAAMRLAESAAKLAEELEKNREAMRLQEVELASRAPLLGGEFDQTRVADRIEKALAEATAACNCDAAALYTLDEDTQHLKTRSVFGLPPRRLESKPRALRGSRGDLEALVQGIVMIDDLKSGLPKGVTNSSDQWNSPESAFRSGICASVQSDDIPIGTLWLFAKQERSFGMAESAAARLAANHISLELTHASIPDLESRRSTLGPMTDVANWQYESLPIGAKLASDWRVDGMVESPRPWAGGWHTWDVLPDGNLMLAIAEASDPTGRGAMVASVARAALAAHAGYRHTPAQLVGRISDTLWQTNSCEQLTSLLYACVDPETGDGEIASAGSINAIIGSRYGYRAVADGLCEPLNTHMDPQVESSSFRINPGESFLAYTAGLIEDGATQMSLGDQLRTAMERNDANPLALIRRSMASAPLNHERGAVTLLRQ